MVTASQHEAGEEIVYTGDPGGEAIHAVALKVLAERGEALNYDHADYWAALDEARSRITFTYRKEEAS